MNTKKPATPLPWKVGAVQPARYPTYPINGQGRNVAQVDIRPQGGSDVDAAYIVHAANAYPKLVAALRDVSTIPFAGTNNGERWDEGYKAGFDRALNQVHALAWSLLRVLGEDV